MSPLSPDAKARLLARVQETPAPTRPQWLRRQALAWLALGAFVGAVAFGQGFDVLHARPGAYVSWMAAAFGMSALFSTLALLRFATSPLGPSRTRLRWLTRAALPLLLCATWVGQQWLPTDLVAEYRYHPGCGLYIMFGGGAVALLFLHALRGADPLTPSRSAVTIALCAGSWIGLAVTLQCPVVATAHVLVAHVMPVGVLMLAVGRWGARRLGLAAAGS